MSKCPPALAPQCRTRNSPSAQTALLVGSVMLAVSRKLPISADSPPEKCVCLHKQVSYHITLVEGGNGSADGVFARRVQSHRVHWSVMSVNRVIRSSALPDTLPNPATKQMRSLDPGMRGNRSPSCLSRCRRCGVAFTSNQRALLRHFPSICNKGPKYPRASSRTWCDSSDNLGAPFHCYAVNDGSQTANNQS